MTANRHDSGPGWVDPDDAPEFTDEMFDRAEVTIGGEVVRAASVTVKRAGQPNHADPKSM